LWPHIGAVPETKAAESPISSNETSVPILTLNNNFKLQYVATEPMMAATIRPSRLRLVIPMCSKELATPTKASTPQKYARVKIDPAHTRLPLDTGGEARRRCRRRSTVSKIAEKRSPAPNSRKVMDLAPIASVISAHTKPTTEYK
jgi:hypothetical protein